MNANETILAFRRRVAKDLGVPRPDLLRLVNKGKELAADVNSKTLKDMKISDREVIIVVKRHMTDNSISAEVSSFDESMEQEVLSWYCHYSKCESANPSLLTFCFYSTTALITPTACYHNQSTLIGFSKCYDWKKHTPLRYINLSRVQRKPILT